ncbi:hypothetical protein DPMN_077571 [Dreissena polymorpha]|uniref:Uncharacterized protein n=1 Tax=Dreissena polymorpha TaxID=45954 RepID=A0A9D3YKQ9_DREPO|nr:hypothetical protein DPMN_077571 [Dreissena polymorpha]
MNFTFQLLEYNFKSFTFQSLEFKSFTFQLLEYKSFTYTYLLADPDTKEAILIDPVLETVDRDVKIVKDMGLKLLYGGRKGLCC